MRDEANELLRSTGKNGENRNVSGPFGITFDVNRFRKAEMGFIKALLLIPVSLVLLLVAVVVFHEWRKASLDAQVREMCEKDGGIKVYETVKLPAEKFNQWGQVDFYKPNQDESALGPEYQIKRDTTYFRRGNPEMSRTHIQLFRTNDQKLLGEAIFYGRGGGDIPGPWYGSGLICPEISAKTDVLRQVFVIDKGEL